MMSPTSDQFRTLQHYWNDPHWLGNRMLFVSGPRQVGKTTLVSQTLLSGQQAYFNWDNRKVRRAYQEDPDFFSGITAPWICFDEIHKRPKWKDILKGIYDTHKKYQFVITGSARLDTFRKSGDSLVGRYFHTHLFPLNLADFCRNNFSPAKNPLELIHKAQDQTDAKELDDLINLGGFPEPYFSGSEGYWKRWSNNHKTLIIREDLRDLTKIVEIDKIESLLDMLNPSIGQPVSYRNFAQDLETTHGSIRRWLETLNKIQLIFSVAPYSKNIRRSYTQERKWYYMDWRAAGENCFENYVACSLLRAVVLWTDRYGDKMSLHFVRTHDQTEVDFLICKEGKPWLLIEAKTGGTEISSAVYRFTRELHVPCIVTTRKKNIFKKTRGADGQNIFSISWSKFGPLLP